MKRGADIPPAKEPQEFESNLPRRHTSESFGRGVSFFRH